MHQTKGAFSVVKCPDVRRIAYDIGSYWIPGSSWVKFGVTCCFYMFYTGVVALVIRLSAIVPSWLGVSLIRPMWIATEQTASTHALP